MPGGNILRPLSCGGFLLLVSFLCHWPAVTESSAPSVNQSSVVPWINLSTTGTKWVWYYNYSLPFDDAQDQCDSDVTGARLVTFNTVTFYNFIIQALSVDLESETIWIGIERGSNSLPWVWADGEVYSNVSSYHEDSFLYSNNSGSFTRAVLNTTGTAVWTGQDDQAPYNSSFKFICEIEAGSYNGSTAATPSAGSQGTNIPYSIKVGPTAYIDSTPVWVTAGNESVVTEEPVAVQPRYTVSCSKCTPNCTQSKVFCAVEDGCWSYKPLNGQKYSGCLEHLPVEKDLNPIACSDFWKVGFCSRTICLSCTQENDSKAYRVFVNMPVFLISAAIALWVY